MRRAKTVLIFLVCGVAAGASFGALLSSPRLLTFWYIKGDKFLIPTYRYYLGVGLFLLLGLAVAYSISRMTGLLDQDTAVFRRIVSGAIVATSPFILFVAADALMLATATTVETRENTTLQLTNIDPITLYLGAIVTFVLLISVACWILTARLFYVGVLINLLTLPTALALLYVAAKIVRVPSEWSELITYPIYFSMLAASCGFWIASGESSRS